MDTLVAIRRMKNTLVNMKRWLDEAEAHAKARSFDPSVLLVARLAPDQFPLLRQIQSACDHAKFTAARISGRDAPSNPDTEQTFEEVRARIDATVAYLAGFSAADFEGAEERVVPLQFMPGKGLRGVDYLWDVAVPNFFFHATHVYAILRHNGLALGKREFIVPLSVVDL